MKQKQKGIVKETDKGTEVRCPNCGQWQPLEDYRPFTLNPHYVTELTPVLQCQAALEESQSREHSRTCMHIFAPTALALKMRQDMLAGVEKK